MIDLLIGIIFAYLVGAIPTGYIFAQYCCDIDITERGSGNIGATNVARVLKQRWYFFLILFIDAAKAYACLWLTSLWSVSFVPIALALLIGNGYSIFLHGKGGKGVATGAGIVAFMHPALLLALVCIWAIMLVLVRLVAIASLIAVIVSLPLYLWLAAAPKFGILIVLSCMSIWIIVRHVGNIRWLLKK